MVQSMLKPKRSAKEVFLINSMAVMSGMSAVVGLSLLGLNTSGDAGMNVAMFASMSFATLGGASTALAIVDTPEKREAYYLKCRADRIRALTNR